MAHAPNIDWVAIKVDWFTQNLKVDKEKVFTLKDLSLKWCISYKTLRKRACQENWRHQLREKIREQNARVIAKVQSEEVATEVEIRRRQAKVTPAQNRRSHPLRVQIQTKETMPGTAAKRERPEDRVMAIPLIELARFTTPYPVSPSPPPTISTSRAATTNATRNEAAMNQLK